MDAELFLMTARAAEDLVGNAAVAARWDEPSALAGYTVGGFAGHLARAVLTTERYLDTPAPGRPGTDAAGYFVQVLASHDPQDSEFHRRVRERSEETGHAQGPRGCRRSSAPHSYAWRSACRTPKQTNRSPSATSSSSRSASTWTHAWSSWSSTSTIWP